MGEEESFIVKDKRRFKEGVEELKEGLKGEEKKTERIQGESRKPLRDSTRNSNDESYTPPFEINFASFIFSLGRSAFIHLGEEPDPVTGGKKVSLPMAKETIDIISLLEEKTRGNLTQEEDQLLKNILYTLRMRYVELASNNP